MIVADPQTLQLVAREAFEGGWMHSGDLVVMPGDILGAVVFLSSDDASFITGQVISVSGGLTMHG